MGLQSLPGWLGCLASPPHGHLSPCRLTASWSWGSKYSKRGQAPSHKHFSSFHLWCIWSWLKWIPCSSSESTWKGTAQERGERKEESAAIFAISQRWSEILATLSIKPARTNMQALQGASIWITQLPLLSCTCFSLFKISNKYLTLLGSYAPWMGHTEWRSMKTWMGRAGGESDCEVLTQNRGVAAAG